MIAGEDEVELIAASAAVSDMGRECETCLMNLGLCVTQAAEGEELAMESWCGLWKGGC